MSIKQEIERLQLAEQVRRDEETTQKRQLVQKIEATEKRLWAIARYIATPFAQKLQKSGVVEILDELRREEDLRARASEWSYQSLFHLSGYHRKDPTPAVLEVASTVEINGQAYHLHGFNLKPEKTGVELSTNLSWNELQEYYDRIIPTRDSKIIMNDCNADLEWNYRDNGYISGQEYEHLRFSLSRENGFFVLELTGGESFPEPSWSIKRFEQAVAKVYKSGLTHEEVPGKPDIGS